MSIVGGDHNIIGGPEGSIEAEAGQITFAAVGGPGDAQLGSGDIDGNRRADVSLRDQARVDTSGNGGGTVSIRGSNLVVENSSISADNHGTLDAAGGIDVNAAEVRLDGQITSEAFSEGNGGDIAIDADRLLVRGNIRTNTSGAGNAGSIMLIANDDLSLPGESFIESLTSGEGDAGSIALEADNITIEGFRSGDVPLFASIRTIALAQSFDVGVIEPIGNAGPITIHANDNLVLNVASIDTSVAGGDADAGDIEIRATNLIMIDSDIQSIAFDSFVCSSLPCEGFSEVVLPTGNSGNINIMAQNVDVGSGSFIGTLTQGTGAAGRVVIIAEDAAFSFGEVNSSSRFSQLFVPDGEVLGPAGDVSVIADTLVLEGSSIRTDATTAEGGRITVQSDDLIDLFRANIISDGVQPGEDDSIITLSAPLIAVNDSRVTSLTGDGAPLLGSGEARLLGDSTVISADSEVAASSTVEITGQEADVGSQLVTLGGVFLDTAPLSARCGARRDIGASSFTGVGRGGLPASPDGPLASAYIVKEARVADLQAAKFRPAIAGAPEDVRLAGFGAPCAPLD